MAHRKVGCVYVGRYSFGIERIEIFLFDKSFGYKDIDYLLKFDYRYF